MRYSQLLIPTVKEVPADAEIPSHRLMIRAGFIRKVASGTYTYLPLGLRMLTKAAQIVREEMNAAGAQEIAMPILQPMELWARTGRDTDYGETMCHFTDRHGRENVLAPTAEEVVTTLVAGDVRSYKQLPLNLYQIQTKFRDEFRPRFGVLRSREFLMKDAYSFDTDLEGLEATYKKMYEAYRRIFKRCGVKYVVVEAESGPIGGSASHEFMAPCPTGEDIIVHTEDYSYAANIEKAEVDPVPVNSAERQAAAEGPAMEKVETPDKRTIDDVCEYLDTKPSEMIKTLIYRYKYTFDDANISKRLASGEWRQNPDKGLHIDVFVVLVRGDHEVNEAKLYKVARAPATPRTQKKVAAGVQPEQSDWGGELGGGVILASLEEVESITGAKHGFAGPFGDWVKNTHLIIDHSLAAMPVGVAGANRTDKTDYHVRNVVPGRDFPVEGDNVIVADIRNAVEGDTRNGKPLKFSRGIEIGHVFKLGTKYSEKLGATYLDENGSAKPCVMGCYGIGINRIIAAAIEVGNDKNGCILPPAIAPFEVEVLILNNDNAEVVAEAERIYNELTAAGTDVLLDDRDARAGVKFKDADLIGIPLRVVVGERGLKEGNVEIKRRTDDKPTMVAAKEAVAETLKMLQEMKD